MVIKGVSFFCVPGLMFRKQVKLNLKSIRPIFDCPIPFFMSGYSQIPNEYCELMPDNAAAIVQYCLKCSKIAVKMLRKARE